ncbi:MAG: hypothetical protein LBS20_07655 [Prevotella sp.]|jgi:hypothetical protein|nr:hypothetical protein [Prevotella sp.]
MKSKDILFKWFGEMIAKYHNIKFFYKYNTNYKSHYIAVFPKDIVDSEDYCEKENSIYESLSRDFENESFLFATEDKRFKITDEFISYEKNNIPAYDIFQISYNTAQNKILSKTTTILIERSSSTNKDKYTKEVSIFKDNKIKSIPC